MFTAIFFTLFVFASVMAGLFVVLFITKKKEFDQYFEDFRDIIDIDKKAKESQKLLEEKRTQYGQFIDLIDIDKKIKEYQKLFEEKRNQYEKFLVESSTRENELNASYSQKKSLYDKFTRQVSLLEDKLDDLAYGLYEAHFNFDTSERYKIEINNVREEQKALIRTKKAAVCEHNIIVEGSRAKGRKMEERTIRLMLRAFNGECDAAVLKVTWNNVQKMKERVAQAYEAINKMGEYVKIAPDYFELKLKEINLTFEYQEKVQAEKEEQRRIREQMREEEKVRREIEKAVEDSIREEQAYQKALEKARHELQSAQGEKLDRLKAQMAILEEKLKEAEERGRRAQSMAEQTKSGHVYVISNIGSFGDDVFKIGLTRRLDPEDRVRELGDASVPFQFDIHAMIYSENAPELETKFHKYFAERQVNRVNPRKEFFRISLNEIEEYARRNGLTIEFTKIAEAKEYRETMAMLLSKNNQTVNVEQTVKDELPASL